MTEPRALVSERPSREGQRELLRKPRYQDGARNRSPLRPLLLVEDFVRDGLLRTGIDSRVVTFSWFIVGLTAHAFTCVGAPWAFVVGAMLVYVKIILDIADGEIGRYQKRFMDERQDVTSHLKGIYLDRVQHAIESPLWGLALGFGAYRMTGFSWCIICGIVLAICRSFWRFESLLKKRICASFEERLLAANVQCTATQTEGVSCPLTRRVWHKAILCVRNGKRFNFLVLSAAVSDWILSATLQSTICVPILLASSSLLGLMAVALRIARCEMTDTLVNEVIQSQGR